MKLSFFKNKKEYSDSELIENYAASKDSYYIGILFKRYSHIITSVAFKYLNNKTETEDAVMEIFEVMLKDLQAHKINSFKSWIYSVTKNHCLKVKRKLYKNETLDEFNEKKLNSFMEYDIELSLNTKIIEEESFIKIENAIKKLSKEQRECIELFYLQNKSYNEIAEITGHTNKSIKSYIQNGKRKIKLIYSE